MQLDLKAYNYSKILPTFKTTTELKATQSMISPFTAWALAAVFSVVKTVCVRMPRVSM